MFFRLVYESFRRQKRRKLLAGAAIALGVTVVTAMIAVATDIGDKINRELRTIGANLLITPQEDTLDVEIGGVNLKPPSDGAFLNEADLPRIKGTFWHNNIIGFAPTLETSILVSAYPLPVNQFPTIHADGKLIGTWASHPVRLPDGTEYPTGIAKTNPWWRVEGAWFQDGAEECVVGHKLAEKLSAEIPAQVAGSHLKIGDTLYVYADSSVNRESGAHPVALRQLADGEAERREHS